MRTFDDENLSRCFTCREPMEVEALRTCSGCHRHYCSDSCARQCSCGVMRSAVDVIAARERKKRHRIRVAFAIGLVAIIVCLAIVIL